MLLSSMDSCNCTVYYTTNMTGLEIRARVRESIYALINVFPGPRGPGTSGDLAGEVHFASVISPATSPLKSRPAGH